MTSALYAPRVKRSVGLEVVGSRDRGTSREITIDAEPPVNEPFTITITFSVPVTEFGVDDSSPTSACLTLGISVFNDNWICRSSRR